MVIYNEIFEHYRNEQKDINKAKTLLKDKGFIVYKRNKNGTKNDKNNT